MKRLLLFLLVSAFTLPSFAQEWGVYRFTQRTVSVYAERSPETRVMDELAVGDKILANACRDGWCAIYFPFQGNLNKSAVTPRGYVPAQFLRAERAALPDVIPPKTSQTCCKICRTGKACGDSCIARSKTCRKGPGCACNG